MTRNRNDSNNNEEPTSEFIKPEEVLKTDRFTDFSTVSGRGFSQLTRAKRNGRWWMLKGLKEQYREDAVYQAFLQKEYEITSQLQHPMVVSVLSLEDVAGLGPCIVMEWIKGLTLKEWLAQGKHSRKQRRHVADMLMEALAYVHSRQTQHRDLKPSNIMLTQDGQHLKLIDFGLSDTDSHAILKAPVGTEGYTAPEGPSDIYSLGCILRELRLGGVSGFVIRKCCAPQSRRYTDVTTVRRDLHRSWQWPLRILLTVALVIVMTAFYLAKIDQTNAIINFADKNVKAICVENWDTNGDGELSRAEAAAVTSLGEVFKDNNEITSFDELRYFTGLTELQEFGAFHGCNALKSITIPANLTSLAGSSFANCTLLQQISVDPANTKYEASAGCNAIIEKATNRLVVGCETTHIPDGITTIGNAAFWGRWGMQRMIIPETVTTIEDAAFAWCIKLTNITLPASVKTIGNQAFGRCDTLISVRCYMEIPPAIAEDVFSNRANATLYVPAGSKAVYEAAEYWQDFGTVVEMEAPSPTITFADAKVKALCVANWDTNGDGELSRAEAAAVTELSDAFTNNKEITSFDELRYFTGLTDLYQWQWGYDGCSFNGCNALRSITIPANVTMLYGESFGSCTGLEKISVDPANTKYESPAGCNAIIEKATNRLVVGCETTHIPDGITTIGNNAFGGRWGMRQMDIPETVTTIEDKAFVWCVKLTNITLPASVKTIGNQAFGRCDTLISVRCYMETPPSITDSVFTNRTNATLYVPAGTTAAYKAADYWKEFKAIKEF